MTHTLFDYIILFFALFVMPGLSAWAGRQLTRRPPSGDQLIRRYLKMLARGWAVVAGVCAVWLILARPFALLGLSLPLTLWDYAGFVGVALGLLFLPVQLWRVGKADDAALAAALRTIGAIKITPNSAAEMALFVLMALTAGVWEELLYRGFLIWFFTPLTGVIGAVLIASIVFGLGHLYQGLRGVVVTGVIGLVLAILYLISGSLWWLMAAHAAVDVFGGFTALRVKRLAAARGIG